MAPLPTPAPTLPPVSRTACKVVKITKVKKSKKQERARRKAWAAALAKIDEQVDYVSNDGILAWVNRVNGLELIGVSEEDGHGILNELRRFSPQVLEWARS